MYILFMAENPHRFVLIDYAFGDFHYHANGWSFNHPDELFESERLIPVNRNLVLYGGDIYQRVDRVPELFEEDLKFLHLELTLQDMMAYPMRKYRLGER